MCYCKYVYQQISVKKIRKSDIYVLFYFCYMLFKSFKIMSMNIFLGINTVMMKINLYQQLNYMKKLVELLNSVRMEAFCILLEKT